MFRKLALTGALAAAIATAPMTAPTAQAADPHDIIGGAIAIGILGAIIADQADRRDRHTSRQRVIVRERPVEYKDHYRPRHEKRHRHKSRKHRHDGYSQEDHFRGERRVSRHEWRLAKRECTRQRWTDRGWETYVSQRCLSRLGY